MMNPRPLCLMENAVYAVSKVLDTNISKGTNLARQWVFPEPEDFLNAPSMKLENGKIQDDQWVDKGLNDEQRVINCVLAVTPTDPLRLACSDFCGTLSVTCAPPYQWPPWNR